MTFKEEAKEILNLLTVEAYFIGTNDTERSGYDSALVERALASLEITHRKFLDKADNMKITSSKYKLDMSDLKPLNG